MQARQNSDQLAAVSCRFADRCPQVMEICRQQMPPLYQTDARRVVACYLYDKAPVVK